MQLTNEQIYIYADGLKQILSDETLYFLATPGFYIQKNASILMNAARDIEINRLKIAQHYGTLDSTGEKYEFKDDIVQTVQEELSALLNITQELPITMIKLDSLNNMQLTNQQLQALMFMIEE